MHERVTLATIAGGACPELFEHELAKVLSNIADINSTARAKRSITIKIVLSPDESREVADTFVEVSSKLASTRPIKTVVYMGRRNGRIEAIESNPQQNTLFDKPAEPKANVVPIAQIAAPKDEVRA